MEVIESLKNNNPLSVTLEDNLSKDNVVIMTYKYLTNNFQNNASKYSLIGDIELVVFGKNKLSNCINN